MMLPQVMLALTVVLGLASANTGRGTVYYQHGVTGSCGQANPDDAIIAAIGDSWMDGESPSPYCGRQIQVTNIGSDDQVGGAGNTLTVTVADTCSTCGPDDIDFSVGAWDSLTDNAGTFNAQW
ncbi:hypothetical protein Egran_04050 [Elaphomyces granulatus]|uniref:RlpA-like protein double-psi beta-barrel domain-containing protein n=1 Tax=Elaphomyces granulatus TaxID=519963 RepID=A0A232LVY1_9EURO|nr:hypothetical protein Egran_04050 [Elaphomyces granulatus]